MEVLRKLLLRVGAETQIFLKLESSLCWLLRHCDGNFTSSAAVWVEVECPPHLRSYLAWNDAVLYSGRQLLRHRQACEADAN